MRASKAHPFSDESNAGLITKLAERITRADALIIQQRTGLTAVHAATAHTSNSSAT